MSDAPASATASTTAPAPRRRASRALRFLVRQPLVVLGLVLTVLMLGISFLGPQLAPFDPLEINNRNRLQPPGEVHRLGTDEFGRDVLSRLLHGARVSAAVGTATLVLATVLGTVFGLFAGYYHRLDGPIMRVMDAFMTFPAIVLAVALIAVLGTTTANVVIALTVVFTPRTARVVRASVLGIRDSEFVESARALGQNDPLILVRHVLPNVVSPLIVQSTFVMANAILSEAALSFIGAGVPAPQPSWGNMLADSRMFMYQASWLTIYPGVAISVIVLGLILVGDGLRDALDPRNLT
jgi:peptide/nickel transport system permease protein